ncbi:hypothetical protein PPL_03471 [Heterostelium album PN500]|uniref:Uncharacterized protein n=1 Tax=Heterostelium pallidum (strain ATCC 26659 / Pp 5 / PN500) TaxID=670386 RepID=D3B4Z5_HETP5|nr:hypothetical protein PPL_03471 [Heterostelium album PN500]EFA84393.1 hypothetical protein PPL_03471 [Heterostelium album PN500]|eukprot:XP_020436507.1 hypothetical protein PPL_03471 [Heterostelium album PN500]
MEHRSLRVLLNTLDHEEACSSPSTILKRFKEEDEFELRSINSKSEDNPNRSPLKKSRKSDDEDTASSPTSYSPPLQMSQSGAYNLEFIRPKRASGSDHMCPSPNSRDALFANYNTHHSNKCSNFERSEQEVADHDNWGEEDLSDDDDCADDDYEEFEIHYPHFHSQFEEMSKSKPKPDQNFSLNEKFPINRSSNKVNLVPNSAATTPSHSPKSHVGTPSRPFPTLDYKVKSEQVKQNPDGTYSCPYETCNKTIKGNKGNLSSHLRWHRRLDAEAGDIKVNNLEEGEEEEFTTPIKPSQRGVQLRNQMIYYGLNLFRQDNQGKYLCFFENCQLRMLTNFSRHIAKHERKGDKIKEELLQHTPKRVAMGSSPTSPPPPFPSPSTLSSPMSLLSHSCQLTPTLSPLQDSFKPKARKILTVNTKVCSNNNVHSPPILSTFNVTSSPSKQLISSPPMDPSNLRRSSSKLDAMVSINSIPRDSDNEELLVPSSQTSPQKAPFSPTSSNWFGSSKSASTNSIPFGNSDEIQWVYKIPNTPTSTPGSPRVFNAQSLSASSSIVPTSPPSNSSIPAVIPTTPTSAMNFQFAKLQFCRSKEDECAKSLMGLTGNHIWD